MYTIFSRLRLFQLQYFVIHILLSVGCETSSHQGELPVKVVFLSCDKWKDHMMYVPSHVIDLIILVQCQDVENILKYKVHLNFRIITALLSSRCTCGYFHKKSCFVDSFHEACRLAKHNKHLHKILFIQ